MATTYQIRATGDRPRIVIIGGGFGGLNVAKGLKNVDAEIFLIDRHNYHLFQPLLYQVATAGLAPPDIASPIRSVLAKNRNIQIVLGEVEWIDRDRRVVKFNRGKIGYDYLIVAAGMENNYFGNDHWKSLAPGLKTLNDAVECRRRILNAFERAEWTQDEELLRSLLTFVVVGGGATGVEMAGAIREIAHEVMIRDFRHIDPEKTRVVLVDAGQRLLTAYDEELSERAKRDLEKMGVEVMLGKLVEDISAEGVVVGGEFIPSQTVIWAAGVKPSPLAKTLNGDLDRMGRVLVNRDLTMNHDDRVFVIGDLAATPGKDGGFLPGLAPVATQQGKHVARQLRRRLKHGESYEYEDFHYWDRGEMATIGKAKAIAQIGNWKFGGFFAWWLWLVVHLLFLIGFRNKIFVILDWFYAYVGSRRGARLIMDTPESVGEELPEDQVLPPLELGLGEGQRV